MLSECLDERVGIETIERKGNGARVEIRDQALLLVGLDAGTSGIVEPTEEVPPDLFEFGVGGSGIEHGAYEGAAFVADVNQPGNGLMHQSYGITAEIAARITEKAFYHLDAPVLRMWAKSAK